jgi:FkbM family methyltransferase
VIDIACYGETNIPLPNRTPPTSIEDTPFQHYTVKHQIVAWISTYFFDGVTYTVRRGLLKGMKRKGGLAWIPLRDQLTAEEKFWKGLNLYGMTVFDVGAFHGLLTLFFASRAKAVVCFEPSAKNHLRLLENLSLNEVDNVMVRRVGLGSKEETRKMVGNLLMPGGSSLDTSATGKPIQDVPVVMLDRDMTESNLPAPDFIKIDIEGFELEALKGARNILEVYKPALFLEMHGQTLREKKRKVTEIVRFLWEAKYRRIWHVETDNEITPKNAEMAMRGHLYCRT